MRQRKHYLRSYDGLSYGLMWSAPFCLIIGLWDIAHGLYFMGITDIVAFLGLMSARWMVNKKYNILLVSHYVVIVASFLFLSALLDGGFFGAGFFWSIGFPSVAFFVMGSYYGIRYSVAYAVVAGVFLYIAPSFSSMADYQAEQVLYGLVVYCAFAGFSYFTAAFREDRELLLVEAKSELESHVKKLAESEANYITVLATTPNAIGVHCEGRWAYLNQAAIDLFGAKNEEDILGEEVLRYVAPDYREMVVKRIGEMRQGNKTPLAEEKLMRKNGEIFEAEVQASPIIFKGKSAILTISRDITEQKQATKELMQLRVQLEHSKRLESLGILASGIAHDFNNILAAIMGNAELASLELDKTSKAGKYLMNVEGACDQAAVLCKQMLAYAGKGECEVKLINLNDCLQSVGKMLASTLGNKVTLEIEAATNLPLVQGDPAQFQQVVLNFIVNASEAIGDKKGHIIVESQVVAMNKESLLNYHNGKGMKETDYVSLTVRDTGCGMNQYTLDKVFDPFFSTKNKGNGLGLSATLGIIQQHYGGIGVTSELGKGSCFEILFPVALEQKEVKKEQPLVHDSMHGRGLVLVVDDDAAIRSLLKTMLAKLGFDVLDAEDGVSGLELFKQHHQSLRLVLLDMTMPNMGGVDTLRLMREVSHTVPIVFVSGFNEVEVHELPAAERPDGFIQKPFRFSELKKEMLALELTA